MNSTKPCTYLLFALFLTADGCNGVMDRPRSGIYRAVLELQGEELPLHLEIAADQDAVRLWVVGGTRKAEATQVTVDQGHLRALLPDGAGTLNAEIHRKALKGTVTLAGTRPVELPFTAEHGENWRFYRESLTDNADVAGTWQLDCGAQARSILTLEQTHDQVSGAIEAVAARVPVAGQVRNEEVLFAGIGAHIALLYRGQVNPSGALQGELLDDNGGRLRCSAARGAMATAAS